MRAKRLLLLGAILFVMGPLVQAAQSRTSGAPATEPVNCSGKWDFVVTTTVGSGASQVTMNAMGDKLSGHYSSKNFGEIDFKGVIRGTEIEFSFPTTANGMKFVSKFVGTMNGNRIRGKVTLGTTQSGSFIGERRR